MQETGSNSKISVLVTRNGFSYRTSLCAQSEWLSADRVFTLPEFQKRYDSVEISVFTPKFTIVPSQFFSQFSARETLSDVVTLSEGDIVETCELPSLGAVAIYSNSIGENLSKVLSSMILRPDGTSVRPVPELLCLLRCLDTVKDYNKVLASFADGRLFLVIAQGRTLMLASSYEAPDFTTAEYFIFSALKRFQMNPEISSVYFRTPLDGEDEVSLYRYFKSVESL